MVARTTGDLPNTVDTHNGNVSNEAEACVTPIPSATDNPKVEMQLASYLSSQ